MSGKYKKSCEGLATVDVDADPSQISLAERPQQDLIPSEVYFEGRDSLSNPISKAKAKIQGFTPFSWLGQCWQAFVDGFFRQSEFKIRQRRDRHGNLWWIVYDPSTNRSAQLAFEDEVRMWIEQSYQHRFRHSQGRW